MAREKRKGPHAKNRNKDPDSWESKQKSEEGRRAQYRLGKELPAVLTKRLPSGRRAPDRISRKNRTEFDKCD